MASGGAEEDDGGFPLDIDDVHMLLQVEHEQIQKRTFTNWINAQLSKRCPPSYVSDLFSDLRDGSALLDLLEVMSGQSMKRQRGHGLFQQRANMETALNFLKKKSIKLVNINISDIIDGRPSIILGLIWTIILHCHIEELASAISFSSRHSSLDSLASLDSCCSSSPVPASPVPSEWPSPLHRRFRISAKKALLMWVRDQCQQVHCSVSVKDFKSSWRSGEVFLAILCSLRPQLVDLSLVRFRSNQDNLEEAFLLAERELHIPRLLEPQDVDVHDPDEKSIMTYVAQFLQYSNDMPAPDDHLQLFPPVQPSVFTPASSPGHFTPAAAVSPLRQVSPSERAQEVTCWLQQAYDELSETWAVMEKSTYAEKYQVFQSLAGSFAEQRRPVMTLFAAIKRCPELSEEQRTLKTAWDHLEEELQRCKADLDLNLPPPLDSVVAWLQRAEAALKEGGEMMKDHGQAAKEARARQENLKSLIKEMSHYTAVLETHHNMDNSGNPVVPLEKFEEIKHRLTNIRVTAKYEGIKLEYQECHHTVLDLLGQIRAGVESWKAPFRGQEAVKTLLQGWHEMVERQGLLLVLMDALQNLKQKAGAYTSKASTGDDSQRVSRQVREAESDAELVAQAVTAARGTMERAESAWESYNRLLASLLPWLSQKMHLQAQSPSMATQDMSEWTSCHTQLNEVGNYLMEVTETPSRLTLAEQLSKVNMQWAEFMKKTKFMLAEAARTCGELQRSTSRLEGRLAELNRWSTDAQDCSNRLQEKTHRGRSHLHSPAKMISRGLQLAQRVLSEGDDLQKLVAKLQKTSQQHLSTSGMQDRISAAVSQCQDILGEFSNIGFKEQVGEFPEWRPAFKNACQPQKQPETGSGSYVVARTKHVSQIGHVTLQAPGANQTPPHASQQNTRDRQGLKIQPVSTKDEKGTAAAQEDSSVTSLPLLAPKSQGDQPAVTQTWNIKRKSRAGAQAKSSQTPTSAQPPVLIHGEVHSRAQSMARSRLEKARLRLQGRIQQAIKLFGGKEFSESQVKKKQKALNILQPSTLEEFLGAVEGFGAFCSGSQLQDLKLLSDSVRKRWEDVRRDLAAFIPILRSKVSGGKQSFSVLQCEINTNHEATTQNSSGCLQQQQAVTDGSASAEEHVESLRELCETLTPKQSHCPAEDRLADSDEMQETQANTSDTELPPKRVQQLRENPPLSPTDPPAGAEPSSSRPPKRNTDGSQVFSPAAQALSTRLQEHIVQPRVLDAPAESEAHLMQSNGCKSEEKPKPSLRAKEQLLKARLLHTVVRSNTVEAKQEAERTIVSEPTATPRAEHSSEQVESTMPSLEKTAGLMESAGYQEALITEKLNQVLRESVDISSLTLAESTIICDLKEMSDALQAEMQKLLEQSAEEEREGPKSKSPSSHCQALHNRVHHLEQLRQQLEDVQSTARALNHFLATLRVIRAEIPTLLANQDPSSQKDEADRQQERRFWQAAMQRLQPAVEQSDVVDKSLKAVGMTLTMESATVTCQDAVKSVSKYILEMEEELATAKRKQREDELFPLKKGKMQRSGEVVLMEMHKTKAGNGSAQQSGAPECSTPKGTDEDSEFEAKRRKQEKENNTNAQREEESQTWNSEGNLLKTKDQRQRRQSSQIKKEDKETLVQRTDALLATLRETKGAAEQLRLQELTLPALQHRTQALTELESALAGLLSEAQYLRGAQSQPESPEESQTSVVEDLWEETTKAVTERLEQCSVLTELLRRFQSIRGKLSGTLQRAESTISEQASYVGRDNLQRLHTKVQETKAELNELGDDVEEVRSVCRQLHTHLRQIPGATAPPFESEAETLMDHWLDLGKEVGSWTDHKLVVLAEFPSFQTEDDIKSLLNEIMTQEESIQRFHQRAAEIQSLLQSAESPLELQVFETQMWKKLEQLKELVSEAEDVYKQMEATKGQIIGRMEECFNSLQKTEDSLVSLSDPDVETILAKLKTALSATTEGEAHLKELRISGNGLLNRDDLKEEVQETIRNMFEQWRELLQSVQLCCRALQADPELGSLYLTRRQKVCCRVEQLQHRAEQLHISFPWHSTAERAQACLTVRQLQQEAESLQSILTDLDEQRRDLAERTSNNVWTDSSRAELETRWSALTEELEALLQDIEDAEQDLSQLATLWGSISVTAEDRESLPQQVVNLQNHKRAIESCSRDQQPVLEVNQAIQQVEEEAKCLQSELRELAENAETLDGVGKGSPGVGQLKQQWCSLQDCDKRLAEVDARVNDLQRTQSLSSTQEMLPTDVRLNASAVFTDVNCQGSDKVCTVLLELRAWDIEQTGNLSVNSSDVWGLSHGAFDAKITDIANTGLLEQKSEITLFSPESAETKPNSLVLVHAELEAVKPGSAELLCKENANPELKNTESLPSRCTVAERQLTGEQTAEGTFPAVKLEEVTDFCQAGEEMVSSAVAAVEELVQTGDALTEMQMAATDNEQLLRSADAELNGGAAPEEAVRGGAGQESTSLPKEKSPWKVRGAVEGMVLTLEQPQILESMELERTDVACQASLTTGDGTGGSAESYECRFTMQDMLSQIQSLVERSNIINRTPHPDLNWYLKSSPGEADIHLVRTLQQVLACRYQPAQLSVAAMVKQLEEAEEHRRCVQEQVAIMKSNVSDPKALKRAEGQWSAALLDASATVQVKAAQLDQVRQYHQKMKTTKAFLEVVAAEKKNMSLNTLGSSALQAEKLHALLETMGRKKSTIEDLLALSSHLSVHLSDAESSGALLAQLGDVQEEWRLLEGSIKRDLRHASNSTCQSSLVLNEAQQLKSKLEDLLKFESNNLSTLELLCLNTDLKLYNQLHLHLESQSNSLINFSLGEKEEEQLQQNLHGLRSLLSVAKKNLDSFTCSCGSNTSSNINKDLRDLIIWAKQAENHISAGQKLALFPEEARMQIIEMRKFQSDILSRRNKMHIQVEEIKGTEASVIGKEDSEVLKTVEDLYEAIADSLGHVLDNMKKNLAEREQILCEFASMDAWLAEMHAKREPCNHVENVSVASVSKLEMKLKNHRSAAVEMENQVKRVETLSESCTKISQELNPGESRYLVNRLSGLWTELDGLLAHEKATSWELEELLHDWTSSNEELSAIQASLEQISADLAQLKFPLTQESLSLIARRKHMLMEHQCQVQELQHCQEAAKRNLMLCSIAELQDRCKALSINAFEQDKYLHLRAQLEESRDIAEEQIQQAKNIATSVGERFRLCQTLLVELPLVKTQCQEAADQLEVISQELQPSELNSEKERIQHIVETLVSWEQSVLGNIKDLEDELLLAMQFNSELPALIEMLRSTREKLKDAKAVNPEEKAIDIALQQYWVVWRNVQSGMRVLEGLAKKQKVDLKENEELCSLRQEVMQDCHSLMVDLSQAKDSLKDYQWAAQGAINFLHNAEATFLSAPGGFLDCTEEQKQTQHALQALEDGFQAHICHVVERVPQQTCLSRPKTELLHTGILSQLLVGRAVLEAQAQLRLECLQRCEIRQQNHRKCHEDIRQRLSEFEARLSECAAEQVSTYDKCVAQQSRAMLLTEDLSNLAVKIEDLRAGCPMQGCGSGNDGELGTLWRRWVSLRRSAGVLMAHSKQRGEEWKDITTSMEQCCSFLANLQADVPDASVNFTEEEPQEVLAQAEMHQVGLEEEQQAISSLEHRLEHALSLSTSHDSISPGPVGKTLMKIQENVRSLKERNLMVVAAAQAEERERQQVQEELRQVEKRLVTLLPALDVCSEPSRHQELKKDLCSLNMSFKCILDSVQRRYPEIPAEIEKQIQDVQRSLQKAEEKQVLDRNSPVGELACRVSKLGSGLERVKTLLEQRSPTVSEAQDVIKRVWDELDSWHSSLMLLESEVQDLAAEQPSDAQLLIDQLTEPQQLYQNAAQLAEQRTAFLSKIPACLQEFEDILHRASCWLEEAQYWLSSPGSFTTAKSLHNHAKSLQLVQKDSERIRHTLQEYKSTLAEISAVCDIRTQETRLDQSDQQIQEMQRNIAEPLERLLQTASIVEVIEADLKMMEKNVTKIRTILSSLDISNMTLAEHLDSRQVILASLQSMRSGLEDIEGCKEELHIEEGAEGVLLVFIKARQLLQQLEDLEQTTQEEVSLLENQISKEEEPRKSPDVTAVSEFPEETRHMDTSTHTHFLQDLEETLIHSDGSAGVKKLLQVLRSQLPFIQYLFQREPTALKSQEDEHLQLEIRAKAVQDQALEQELACQRMLQQSLVQLHESRAVLGLLLDQEKMLQDEPSFAASTSQAGGALELRWRNTYRRTQQEIQRCRGIRGFRTRFQADFGSVTEWLLDAREHLKTLSGLADSSDLSQEAVQSSLVKLLDFSMEMEARSVLRASVSQRATRLLHLREVDCPDLRSKLNQLEVSWSQMTSDLSRIQEQLQQRPLAAQPPLKLLSELEDRREKMQVQLNQEKQKVVNAESAEHIAEILQQYQVLKTAVASGQLLLDFLSQPGRRVVGADIQALRSEQTTFAEKLGAARLQWLLLHRDLETQIHEVEQIHHTCTQRERQLKSLHGWIQQQKQQLSQWKQPATSQTLACKALLEQEIEHVGQALGKTVEEWTCFYKGLRDVALRTTSASCALQHRKAPFFSVKQADGYLKLLQDLQAKATEGEALWIAVDKSYQRLVDSLLRGAAQALGDQVQEERKRWKDVVEEIKEEITKTGRTLSLWNEYTHLSDSCSLCLQHLWHEWERLSSSLSPERDAQAVVSSMEGLQDGAAELQSSLGDLLAASKCLTGRLEPLAASVVQSETRLLSRDVLLLNLTVSARKKSLQVIMKPIKFLFEQEDVETQDLFSTRLEDLERHMQNLLRKLKTCVYDADSVQHVLFELSDLVPSLVDVKGMSGYMTPSSSEMERLQTLCSRWVESMTQASAINRELHGERQRSQNFQEKCEKLKSIQDKLELESACRKPPTYSNLQEILMVHQRLQAEGVIGHQLLQDLLVDALGSELMGQVVSVKKTWFSSVSVAVRSRTLTKEHLLRWRLYSHGSKLLWKLLRVVDSFLPPAGPSLYSLQQLQNCSDVYQHVEESQSLYSPVYKKTVEAGELLCETVTEPECRSRLQSELQDIKEAWERTSSLLKTGKDLASTAVECLCTQRLHGCLTGRCACVCVMQETELSLQRLAAGLKEVATMKTDLSQYVAASDSALLEQQLEQLSGQWGELCTKVSLRRQEIADRLNAWSIFNDKNKEFCDWLTQMEDKVCHDEDLSIEEMVEKLKKDCMEEINLFSENKSHLKQLGEQLLVASDEAKQSRVHGSLQEINQRWHNLFRHIEARVKKLKETLVAVQQLDKNMSNLRSWLSRIEAVLSRPITYSVCHEREIQRRLAEQQELQKDIEQHTEGVASVLSLCDVLLHDEDAASGSETESDSLQETSRSLDQRWRTICTMALDRRLRIEETWTLWCKFLSDYSRFEDWLKMAERTAANPNSADVLFSAAKEELKKFEGFQRQVNERLTQLELINNQYRRLARENRTDRASQLKAMVREGNQRWDTLHRRVAAILRRLKHFTSQREEFEGTRESMLVWLTELDLQLTNVEHFSESDVHHKIQQLNSFQKEITLNTERIDGLIVFGEGLIQKSSPQDAALIEDELEELHTYCQEVFGRLVRFHQRLSQPPMVEEPEVSGASFSLESSLELIGRPWLGRSQGSLPATPIHLLMPPLERSGRETPLSVDSLPLEWDHTVDVGSSSHEDEEEEEEHNEDGTYFSEGVIERWELHRAQSRCSLQAGAHESQQLASDLGDVTCWLEKVTPELDRLLQCDSAASVEAMEAKAKELKEMQKMFAHYKSIMLSANLQAEEAPELQERLSAMNRDWSSACTGLQRWDASLRKTLMRCQEFHETLHSLLLWLAHAESRRFAVDVNRRDTSVGALRQHYNTLTELREELRGRRTQQASLQALWSQLQPEDDAEESDEAREKLHVTGSKLKLLLRDVEQDVDTLQQRLDCESASAVQSASEDASQKAAHSKKGSSARRDGREPSPPRSLFYRVLRAAFPLQFLLLLLLLLPCLIPLSDSEPGCTVTNNFARSFYPMLHYTNGPPPT
ncbi:nesprin-2-like [Xenentodon cancila]